MSAFSGNGNLNSFIVQSLPARFENSFYLPVMFPVCHNFLSVFLYCPTRSHSAETQSSIKLSEISFHSRSPHIFNIKSYCILNLTISEQCHHNTLILILIHAYLFNISNIFLFLLQQHYTLLL